jgi:hypothetical protein
MKRLVYLAGLLLLGSSVLGATVFRDQVANAGATRTEEPAMRAASGPPTQPVVFTNGSGTSAGNTVKIDPANNGVSVMNTDIGGNVKVHEQGTAAVHVTNSSLPVSEQNTDSNGYIKVHEQGTANVNITNSSLPVGSATPITGGSGSVHLTGDSTFSPGQTFTATFLSIHMNSDANGIDFRLAGTRLILFDGPANAYGGVTDVNAPLSRPISFDSITCGGAPTATCDVSWIGDSP